MQHHRCRLAVRGVCCYPCGRQLQWCMLQRRQVVTCAGCSRACIELPHVQSEWVHHGCFVQRTGNLVPECARGRVLQWRAVHKGDLVCLTGQQARCIELAAAAGSAADCIAFCYMWMKAALMQYVCVPTDRVWLLRMR